METADDATISVGSRVTFPYGGSRRTGTVADIAELPNGAGTQYLIDVGTRKVFVQGDGVTLASSSASQAFDAVAEGVAYGRKRPRNPRRR